ncbi:hypothetical protein MVEN_00399600 [Mycena venus]|uniref:Uncharacterized protein n=1 Tax=Mycena venus TaxID=2733690 RepID=A0A8H7DAU6_9AGAR|nr:hypothetical protein MVEN_00399600 [Mycena venus]
MLSYKTVFLALLLSSSSLALPIRREVPQEHSHQAILTAVQSSLVKNNPDGIVDAVFGLLGNAAAAGGLGKLTDANCLQQATADQAFTNAKAAGDVDGQVNALIYRALERNSGTVGGTTTPCTTLKAVNPEIAAIQQHQDPASTNAAAVNKAIVLELAKQIASVGGNPTDALKSGTFAPGNIGDPTGKGNTCDDANDAAGCIVSQNLLVPDATEDEINAAVSGVTAASTGAASSSTDASAASASDASASCASAVTVTVNAGSAATEAAATTSAADVTVTATASSIGNFGSCSIPQIEFGPVDKTSFNHGSAQAISIITQFMCDTLVNSCNADATAKATCAAAQAAANAAPPKQGIDADIFNGFFGIATNFRNIEAVDDQGNPIAGTTGGSVSVAATGAAETGAAATATAAPASATTAISAVDVTATSSSIGNFGSCSIPQIEFGVGFDNRKETSFQPVDKTSFNHGSAQAISIITQFMCDTLVNSCNADATAKATCAAAQAAANAAPPKQGIDADIFNGFFGIATNFRNVQAVDDQGNPIAGTTGGSVSVAATGAAETGAAAATTAAAAATTTAAAAAATTAAASSSSGASSASGNVQTFTGALGGLAAPPVTAGGSKGFVVDGSEFINEAGALGRSCDVQHNLCANAANSGGGFSVSDCDTQNNACHAAIST